MQKKGGALKTYNDLYAAWRWETTEATLGGLPPDFYAKIAAYLRRINEDTNVDKKSVKVALLEHEAKNVNRMLDELLKARYKKIIKNITKNQRAPSELLTVEEAKMCETFASFSDSYQKFAKGLTQGQTIVPQIQQVNAPQSQPGAPITVRVIEAKTEPQAAANKRLTLRFTKSIPAIMGADMKSYGPFVAEDVASLPAVNAKMLVKQGLAVLVEVS
jgi:DNA replication initiation complex subunit (GINS family)